jgi:hypothetical protein
VINGPFKFNDSIKVDRTSWFNLWGPFVNWYTDPNAGLHLEFMVGMSSFEINDSGFTSGGIFGWGLQGGVGYDWWVSEKWAIGVAGQLQYGNMVKNNVTHNVLMPGLLATFTYY